MSGRPVASSSSRRTSTADPSEDQAPAPYVQRKFSSGTAIAPDQPQPSTSRESQRRDELTQSSLALQEAHEALSRLDLVRRTSGHGHDQRQHQRSVSVTPSSTSISEGPNEDDRDDYLTSGWLGAGKQPIRLSHGRQEVGEKKESGAHVDKLPNEVLSQVFGYLTDPKDVYRCLQVSWTWFDAAHPILWQRPSLNRMRNIVAIGRVLRSPNPLQPYAQAVRRINMSGMAKDEVAVSDDMLLAFSTCVNADRLTLSSNLDVSSATLCRVIERLPKLVAVDISGCHLAADKVLMTLAATCANELQGLNISGCERIGDEGLLHLADTSIVLRRLKASKCIRLTDKSLVEIARNCPSLLEVDFAGLGQATSATVYAIFLNLSQLREFKFSHNPFITDAGFPNLPALTAMHQIDSELAAIRAPKYTTTRDLDPTSSDPPRMLMPKEDCLSQLKVVDLTDCPGFGDQGLENLIASAPCIRALTLAKCAALTDTGLQHIAKLGRNLQHLHLAHVAQITDPTITKIARACTRLRYIDLACCPLLTDMSVFELAANVSKIKRIGLVKVVNITDQAIYALVERASTLERLHLSYCDKLTVSSIGFMLNRLTRLTHLSLTGVSAFRTPEVKQYCRKAPSDFNDHQRDVFCVFSGPGIALLRRQLSPIKYNSDAESMRRGSESSDDSAPASSRNMAMTRHRHRQVSADQSMSSAMGSTFASVTPNFLSPGDMLPPARNHGHGQGRGGRGAPGRRFFDVPGIEWTQPFQGSSTGREDLSTGSPTPRFHTNPSALSRHRGSEPSTAAEQATRSSTTRRAGLRLPSGSAGRMTEMGAPSTSTSSSSRGLMPHRDRDDRLRRGSGEQTTATRSYAAGGGSGGGSSQVTEQDGDRSRWAPAMYMGRFMQLAGLSRERERENEREGDLDRQRR